MTSLALLANFDPFTWIAANSTAQPGAAAVLALSTISDWLSGYTNKGNTALLIKEKLASGKVSLVAGVFGPTGNQLDAKQWEANKLDAELDAHFQHSSRLLVNL